MPQKQITVWVDLETRKAMIPLLKRDGLSLSSFIRKAMADYLEAHRMKNGVLNIDAIEGLR